MSQLFMSLQDLPEYKYECIDALEFCKGLDSESAELIMTSPPYNIGKSYETRVNINDYIANFEPLISQLVRILASDGSICWQVGNFIENSEVYPLDIYFYPLFKSVGLKLRNRIIWHFEHGLHCSKRFSGRYEVILWFTKSENYIFNLDDVRVPSKYPGKKYYKGSKRGELSGNPKGKNPSDIWEMTLSRLYDDWDALIWDVPNVKNNHPEKLNHPCQYPVELVERCVLALTNPGGLVLDPFAGVGSTLIAALKNNRRAFGSEREKIFVDSGLERIAKLQEGTLITRPIYKEIWTPSVNDKIAQVPEEWKQ
ncbi:MAG: site-specific DNA-methyltransferase [Synergistaceae bacterium]|nr:site-specific DNA-methyltransferase [Synergistaceae bacterium]